MRVGECMEASMAGRDEVGKLGVEQGGGGRGGGGGGGVGKGDEGEGGGGREVNGWNNS